MVNDALTTTNPEIALAISYVPAGVQSGLAALMALDARLADILRTTSQPLVGQMRLTWWHEALVRLDVQAPPAEPVLAALHRDVLPRGVSGASLAVMVEAWETLLDDGATDDAALNGFAMRGVILFGAMATLAGAGPADPVAPAGRGWALADLARHVTDPAVAEQAAALAQEPLRIATSVRWSRAGRAIGALAHSAAMDLAVPAGRPLRRGSPGRVFRLLYHRLTGS